MLIKYLGFSSREIDDSLKEQLHRIERRILNHKCVERYSDLSNKKVLIDHDGIVASYTMDSSVWFLNKHIALEIVVTTLTRHVDSVYKLFEENVSKVYYMNPRSSTVCARN